jgi:hypothetical protein
MTGLGESTRGLDCTHMAEIGRFAIPQAREEYERFPRRLGVK